MTTGLSPSLPDLWLLTGSLVPLGVHLDQGAVMTCTLNLALSRGQDRMEDGRCLGFSSE